MIFKYAVGMVTAIAVTIAGLLELRLLRLKVTQLL